VKKEPLMDVDNRRYSYREIGVTAEGWDIQIEGLNPWKHEWIPLPDPPIELPHPQYRHQLHRMNHYAIVTEEKTVAFAAGELSASVWGFYLALER
jgi:hypothetical protein